MKYREVTIKNIKLSHSQPIVVQSMTNTETSNIVETVKQINALHMYGAKLVRVAILNTHHANALKQIVNHVTVPIVADIHFDYRLAILAIENGASKIRINPGNIQDYSKLKKIVDCAKAYNVAIRIGINGGSIKLNQDKKIALQMVKKAIEYIELFESWDFKNIVVSLKHSNFEICKEANLIANKKIKYPLHIGVTEAGGLIDSTIKTTLGLTDLLKRNIGQTIRVSINDDPVKEVIVAYKLLKQLNLVKYHDIVSCPLCGRNQFSTHKWLEEIDGYLSANSLNIKVGIMGCNVNGPGESKQCDVAVCAGVDKSVIYNNGKAYKTVLNKDVVKAIKSLIELRREENEYSN